MKCGIMTKRQVSCWNVYRFRQVIVQIVLCTEAPALFLPRAVLPLSRLRDDVKNDVDDEYYLLHYIDRRL